MQKAIILSTNDIKAIIAEKYGVPIKNVVKSQYASPSSPKKANQRAETEKEQNQE